MLQPRRATTISSRTVLRKALGLERLPAKLTSPQATPTLELWVHYQHQKVSALCQSGPSTRTATEPAAESAAESAASRHNCAPHIASQQTISPALQSERAGGNASCSTNSRSAAAHLVASQPVQKAREHASSVRGALSGQVLLPSNKQARHQLSQAQTHNLQTCALAIHM